MRQEEYCPAKLNSPSSQTALLRTANAAVPARPEQLAFGPLAFEVPRAEPLRSVLTSRYPSYFEPPPLDDARPNETSWTVFRKHLEDRAP